MGLKDGLVEYWSGNETPSGTRTGSHVGKTLTEDGGTVASAAGFVYTNAADFESADTERLGRSGDADLEPGDNDFSVMVAFNMESVPGEGFGHVLVDRTDADDFIYRCFVFTTGGVTTFGLGIFGDGSFPSVNAADSLVISTWYLGIATHDATANVMTARINNGTVASASTLGPLTTGNAPFSVGADSTLDATKCFDGLVFPIAVWNRKLASDEQTRLFNNGLFLKYENFDDYIPQVLQTLSGGVVIGRVDA
jgi:hypothetical protein